MPEDEARRAANETFKGNMSLVGLDAAEFATAFMPMKFNTNIIALRVLSTLGKVGGVAAMEGAEERYQQIVQEMAVDPEVKISDFFTNNPNLNEATAIGAIFGVGLGGAGSVYTAFTDRVVNGFTPESKALFDSLVEDKKAEGLTSEEATKKVLDEIASTPEGEKEIKASVEKIKESAQNITSKQETIPMPETISTELEPLAQEARKYDSFDKFEKDFSINLAHGLYWHVTDSPDFEIKKGFVPADAVSSGSGKGMQAGLMASNNPEYWYDELGNTRKYAAELDLSNAIPGKDYTFVNRGFGQEIFINNPEAVKVKKTIPIEQAINEFQDYYKILPASKEELQQFYNKAKSQTVITTPKAEDVTEADITEFVESEIAPEKQFQKAPVETIQTMTGLIKKYVEDTGEKVNTQEDVEKVKAKYPEEFKKIEAEEKIRQELWNILPESFRKNRGINEYSTPELQAMAGEAAPVVSKEIISQSLIEEAKKYKTEEEFKALGFDAILKDVRGVERDSVVTIPTNKVEVKWKDDYTNAKGTAQKEYNPETAEPVDFTYDFKKDKYILDDGYNRFVSAQRNKQPIKGIIQHIEGNLEELADLYAKEKGVSITDIWNKAQQTIIPPTVPPSVPPSEKTSGIYQLDEKVIVGDLNLNVGDEFEINGEKFKVTEKDIDGNFKIKDGVAYIVDEFDKIPKPDDGSIKRGGNVKLPVITEKGFKVVTPETEGVKTIKQRIRQTTGQVTLANMIREDKALEAAFKKAQQAAREAFRAGNKEGVEAEKVKMKNFLGRAKKIKAIQEFFGLTYANMKTVSRKNPFLMSQYEFKLYLDDVRQKSFEKMIVKDAKIALKELIRTRNLQKVENLQRALKYPSIDKMNLDQLNNFFDILDQYKKDDVFLSERRLEVVDRTDLKGIKTWREAKEALAKEVGVPVEELEKINVSQWDKFRYDSALMQQNPFYRMMVTETHRELLNAEMRHHEVKLEAYRLAKAAEASRPQTLIHKFIPQNKLIMGYIEASAEQKSIFLHNMTPEEIDYAHFIEEYFENALEYLVETQSLTKGRENYFVHMRQGFLENVKEEGLLTAVKNIFKHYKEDEVVFNILDEDTGNILPLEKFFQFSLHRTGGLLPTSNVTEAFLAYSKMFEKKVSFDQIIPKLDIYAQALTPQKLTPHGLEMDRSLKKFVNQYINNKKGRHIDQFVGKQGGAVDLGLRAVRSFTSLLDLGFNIPVGITAFIGEQVTNFVQLGVNNMAKGAERAFTQHGKAIIEKYEAWLVRSPWENFTAPGKGITEKIHEGLFVGFHESARIANINFLLGMITEEEFTSETISDKRLAELQLEMGRMRVVPGSKSLVGSTSLGSVLTQYKTWAIPILSTLKGDISTFVSDLTKKPTNEALATKEARELYRIVGLSSAIIITGAVLAGDDDENDMSFLGAVKRKFYRESLSLIGALDPTLYTPIRALSFMSDLAKNLKAIALLEEKGIEGLKKQLTPKAIRQFIPEEKKFKR